MIVFGPPGAGKGTQAQRIGLRMGIPHISSGDIIRRQVSADSPLGHKARAIMEQGSLIPDEWVNQIVEERLKEPDCKRGFVLDGFPRTHGQAQVLDAMLSRNGTRIMVLNIAIGYNEIIRRITGRRVCPRCGAIYNIYGKPPLEADRCDLDQTPLEVRADDREQVIHERIQAYENQTRPVMDYFRERGRPVHEVDGSLPPEQVSDRVFRILDPQ